VAPRKDCKLARKSRRIVSASEVAVVGNPKVRIAYGKDVKWLVMFVSYKAFAVSCQRSGSRARNPAVSRFGDNGITPSRGTSPWEGLFPKQPFTSDGPRIDPPVSDLSPISSQSYAPIPAPGPDEEEDGS
jgi:hypothetical protein